MTLGSRWRGPSRFLQPLAVTAAVGAVALPACSTSDDDMLEWGGESPHLIIRGTINGETLDVNISGADAGMDKLLCEREYFVPIIDGTDPDNPEGDTTMAVNTETKLLATFEVDGEERHLSLEFKAHPLQSDALGAVVEIVPRSDTQDPEADQMWLEFEWLDSFDGEEIFESAATEGTFTLELYSGTEPADTIIIPDGEGAVGGLAVASWSATESLEISFSALCGPNDLDIE